MNYSSSAVGRLLDVSTGTRKFIAGTCGNGVCYNASGDVLSATMGANITLTNTYNSRLQPTLLSATGSSGTLMSRSYDFVGNVTDNGETGNNGNIYKIIDNLDPLNIANRATGSTVFEYDKLNRITQAKTTGTDCTSVGGTKNWGNTYTIDAWGNLTNKGAVTGLNGCFAENMNQAVGLDNRFTGANSYDAAGNMVGNGAYVFDAENRIIKLSGDSTQRYVYDGDGNRVSKPTMLYWRGTGMEELAESDATGALTAEYIYFGGKRIARLDTPTVTTPPAHYYISDHLGTASVIASEAGAQETETMYYPFGGERWTVGSDPNHYKFTGKERDSESGLDMFGARYYGSSLGRFVTPDWAAKPTPVPYAVFGDPQSLNLYSYVRNNPLSKADPDGHCSAPKVGNGQVGICVDLYIRSPIVPKLAPGVGLGDNRGPAANASWKSYRQEIQLVVTPGQTPQKVKDDGGTSVAITPIGAIWGKGSSDTKVSGVTTDKGGTEHFNISSTGLNGLASLPGAPKDTIKTSLNFSVTPDGKVGMDPGGVRTAYPSIEVYAYGADGSTRTIYQKTESGNVDDLKNQNQPVPAVSPQ